MEDLSVITSVCGGIILILTLFLVSGIRIVPEYRRLFVYRLGHFIGEKGPGFAYLIPIIDRAIPIDLRKEVSKAKVYQHTIFGEIEESKPFTGPSSKDVKSKYSLKKYFQEAYNGLKTLMNPDYDLGIKNVRIRGIIRVMMGIFLTSIFVFLTIGGASIYGKMEIPEFEEGEDNWFFIILILFPGLSAFFFSMHVLWGIVELLLNKMWNQLSSSTRIWLILFIGAPLGILLIASIIFLASQIF